MRKITTIIFLLLVGAFVRSNAQGLVINEIDYDQPGADSAEFLELYNSSSSPINLGNYAVLLVNGSNNLPYDSFALPSQMLNAGAYFVICGFANGQVPLCDMIHTPVGTGLLQNGSPDAVAIRDINTLNLVDVVSYEGSCAPPWVSGHGVPLAQSDTGNTPYISTGRFPDGMDTNDDSTDFHRQCITPGTANVSTNTGCTNPVAVRTITAKKDFSVYPNPSNGYLNIGIQGVQFRNATATVSNLLGNEIRKISFKNSDAVFQFSISDLEDGVYFVKIKSDAGDFMQRIILKK